jgi:hypothetical protein
MRLIIAILLTSLMTAAAQAEVVKSTSDGFIIQHSVTIDKDKIEVFHSMTTEIGKWWSSDHSFSGDNGNMLLDSTCFCERWDGNLVRHLNTEIWLEDSKVVMQGGLGPLKELGLSGTMIWSLVTDTEAGTTVTWAYHVYGYSETALVGLAVAVDGVLLEQINGLAGFLANPVSD